MTQPPQQPYHHGSGPGYEQGYGYPPQRFPETSSKAIIALVLGVVAFTGLGPFASVPAIFLGHIARKEIDAANGMIEGRGMATAGYVLGIIGTVLAVVMLLLVIGLIAFAAFLSEPGNSLNNTAA